MKKTALKGIWTRLEMTYSYGNFYFGIKILAESTFWTHYQIKWTNFLEKVQLAKKTTTWKIVRKTNDTFKCKGTCIDGFSSLFNIIYVFETL